jgi:hypothetical protein
VSNDRSGTTIFVKYPWLANVDWSYWRDEVGNVSLPNVGEPRGKTEEQANAEGLAICTAALIFYSSETLWRGVGVRKPVTFPLNLPTSGFVDFVQLMPSYHVFDDDPAAQPLMEFTNDQWRKYWHDAYEFHDDVITALFNNAGKHTELWEARWLSLDDLPPLPAAVRDAIVDLYVERLRKDILRPLRQAIALTLPSMPLAETMKNADAAERASIARIVTRLFKQAIIDPYDLRIDLGDRNVSGSELLRGLPNLVTALHSLLRGQEMLTVHQNVEPDEARTKAIFEGADYIVNGFILRCLE